MSARDVGASLRALLDRLARPRPGRLSRLLATPGLDRLFDRPPKWLAVSFLDQRPKRQSGRVRLARPRPRIRASWQAYLKESPARMRSRFARPVQARAAPPQDRAEIRQREYLLAGAAGLAVVVLVVCPLLALFAGSLRSAGGLTLGNIGAVVSQSLYLNALLNTLILGFFAAVLSLAIGVALAWAVARANVPGKTLIHVTAIVCLLSPPFFTALAFVRLFHPGTGSFNLFMRGAGLPALTFDVFSMAGLVLVTVLHTFTFVYFFAWKALRALDPTYERAGMLLGAGRLKVAISITAPLVRPAVLTGTLMAFVVAVAQFAPQAVIGLPAKIVTLPTRIYLLAGQSQFGLASALSLVFVIITLAAVYLWRILPVPPAPAMQTERHQQPQPALPDAVAWVLSALGLSIFVFAVLLPALALFAASLSTPSGETGGGWTFAHYRFALFGDPLSGRAILNSVLLAAIAATAAVGLGVAVGWVGARTRVPERRLLAQAALVSLGVPGTVFAVGLVQLGAAVSPFLLGTLTILLFAYVGRFLPFGYGAADVSLARVDPAFEQSARALGASWNLTMREVALLRMGPGIGAGWVIVFVAVVQELGASILLFGRRSITLPVAVYHLYETGKFERAAALAVVGIAIIATALWLASRLDGSLVLMRSLAGRKGATP